MLGYENLLARRLGQSRDLRF